MMRLIFLILTFYIMFEISIYLAIKEKEKENREDEQNNIKWWNN